MNTSPERPPASTPPSHGSEDHSTAPLHRRTIPSEQLLAGEKEIWIQHGDAVYRLCETKSGKLILQK